nr:B-cell differentiation antigen CD72-like isoform X2 [Zootoca vivipara]
MSQDVTYADLRFVRTPLEKSQGKDPSEGELTYENVQGPPCQEERNPTATEGRKDWQVSRQLQQANEDGSALARRIGSKEGSLAQAQVQLEEAKEELHSTNKTLWSCWAAGNRTQEKLRQANESLMLTQQEKEELEQEKEQHQQDNARLQEEKESLQQQLEELRKKLELDCSSHGWNPFGWKCLWISPPSEMKSWWNSQEACKKKSSQLLVLKPWTAEQLWGATFIDKSYQYWIGLQKFLQPTSWKWVDGTDFEGTENFGTCDYRGGYCIRMSQGALEQCGCSDVKRFICEKKARYP